MSDENLFSGRPISPQVLHVVSSLQLGGAERFVIDLSKLQRQHAINSEILSLGSFDDFLISETRVQKIPLHVSCASEGRISRYRSIYQLFLHANVIHIHSPSALRYVAPILPFFRRKRIIYTRHGLHPLRSRVWIVLHQILRPFIHTVTFVTRTGADSFSENHRWSPSKICIIENGVYMPDDSGREIHSPVSFGSVGRMVELKGQSFLLESLGRLAETLPAGSWYQLHFFGSGPLEEYLRSDAGRLPQNESIFFHGSVVDREAIYQCIDVLVVSSVTEGLSLVIMEAMARGICVIATDVGGNSTLVKHGVNGIVIPSGDQQAMSAAFEKLIFEPGLIREYGLKAREFIAENYSLYTSHTQYLQCYFPSDYIIHPAEQK